MAILAPIRRFPEKAIGELVEESYNVHCNLMERSYIMYHGTSGTIRWCAAGIQFPFADANGEVPQPFQDPVMLADGTVYEYLHISAWLNDNATSPCVNGAGISSKLPSSANVSPFGGAYAKTTQVAVNSMAGNGDTNGTFE